MMLWRLKSGLHGNREMMEIVRLKPFVCFESRMMHRLKMQTHFICSDFFLRVKFAGLHTWWSNLWRCVMGLSG